MSGPDLVYFIKPKGKKGPIKIGCSNSPVSRVETLAAWSPWPLEIIGSVKGSYQDEQFLHECFAQSHLHREWFKTTPGLLLAIEQVLAAGSVDVVRSTLTPTGSIRKGRKRKQKSADEKLRFSYDCRIRNTCKRLRKGNEFGRWHEPKDVSAIMSAWTYTRFWDGKAYVTRERQAPTADQLARLNEYLADPVKHSVIPDFRLPKEPICIPIFVDDEQVAA